MVKQHDKDNENGIEIYVEYEYVCLHNMPMILFQILRSQPDIILNKMQITNYLNSIDKDKKLIEEHILQDLIEKKLTEAKRHSI